MHATCILLIFEKNDVIISVFLTQNILFCFVYGACIFIIAVSKKLSTLYYYSI